MKDNKVILEKQDMTYLQWSHARKSSGTVGTYLKASSILDGEKTYYKLSNYDSEKGIVGHECVNEIIADRLLSLLGVEHLEYQLIHADVQVDGEIYETYLCASKDFKKRGESKTALDNYYQMNSVGAETHYEFCVNNGWKEYIDQMLVVDYLIMNRDRHGSNMEVLRNARNKTIRISPLFDHGLSLLCFSYKEEEIEEFDIGKDLPCNNFIGLKSTKENLKLIKLEKNIFDSVLKESDRNILFEGLESILSKKHLDKIWDLIWTRWCYYESLWNI